MKLKSFKVFDTETNKTFPVSSIDFEKKRITLRCSRNPNIFVTRGFEEVVRIND